jgi:hypothetical protein
MRWRAYKAVPLAVVLLWLTVAGSAGALDPADGRHDAPALVAGELFAGDHAVLRLPEARASTAWIEGRQGERRAPALGQAAGLGAVATLWLIAALGLYCASQCRPVARGNPRQGRAPPVSQLV